MRDVCVTRVDGLAQKSISRQKMDSINVLFVNQLIQSEYANHKVYVSSNRIR